MRTVTLAGTDVTTTVLGYGCGELMARTGRAESARCLRAALDAGVTHFDTARLYGYGEAEGVLGAVLEGRRDEVTITTKLGIAPPRRSRGLALAKAAARRVVAVAPALRRAVRRGASGLVSGGQFGVDEARASLETSLRELRTDHVDVLLLHECGPEDLTPELHDFLEERTRAGSVRHFGIATDLESSRRILEESPAFAQVVQVPNSVLAPALPHLGSLEGRALISHSVVGPALSEVHRHVTASSERRRAWSEAVGADCSSRPVLASLLLAHAVAARPGAMALFSSRDEDHIGANARSVDAFAPEQVERFGELAGRELDPAPVPR